MVAALVALVAALVALVAAPASSHAARSADDRVRDLVEEFVARSAAAAAESNAAASPAAAGALRVTAGARAAELAWLRDVDERLALVPRQDLSHRRAQERRLLEARLERTRLDLEVIRPLERDPAGYLPLVAGAVASVLERPGSPCERLRAAARLLSGVPELLRAAHVNLPSPPKVLVENAIEEFAGVLRFYRETVPAVTSGCRSPRMQADLAEADTAAVRAVEGFVAYLREDLLREPGGPLAIGAEASERLLRVLLLDPDVSVDSLRAEAERAIDRHRAELEALAPGGVPAALDALALEGAGPEGPITYLEQRLAAVRQFLAARDLLTLPARAGLGVREAPPLRRGQRTVALQVAPARDGRRDARSVGAWLEVAPPAPVASGTADRAGRRGLHRWEVDLAVAHEGLPGRHLRRLALERSPARQRAALQEAWPGHDWGIYCERMILEEGYGDGDPRYRLAAAARALREEGRSLAALGLHTGAMTPEEARRMLESRCLLPPGEAAREVQRAAANPDLMGYAAGARRLLELRDETRRSLGPRFRGKVFNDALLRFGASPPGLVRADVLRELGAGDAGTPVGVER